MGVTALDIKKVCLRCVAVIIVAFVMPTGIWLYARSAKQVRQGGGCGGRGWLWENTSLVSLWKAKRIRHQSLWYQTSLKRQWCQSTAYGIWIWPQEKQTPSVSAEVPSPLPAQDVTDKIPYPASMEGNDGVIEKIHLRKI